MEQYQRTCHRLISQWSPSLSGLSPTGKVNSDELQDKVKNVIGPWKGGKFMPLSLRSHSLNTYCLSKLWFKCPSINLRVCDHEKITSNIKSWLFQDQLVKPEEFVLYRPRSQGGLGLVSKSSCSPDSFFPGNSHQPQIQKKPLP